MSRLLFTVFTLITFNCLAQINFEEGYYLPETGDTVTCFIKNKGWKNNPSEFQYRLTKEGETLTTDINSVKEFYVSGIKYERYTIEIDLFSQENHFVSSKWAPDFQTKTLFLRALITGKVSLYGYEDGKLRRFFYKKQGEKPKQLVFKEYQITPNKIATNESFKQSLLLALECDDLNKSDFQKLRYTQTSLIKVYKDFYSCIGEPYVDYSESGPKSSLKVNLKLGSNFSSFSLKGPRTNGAELEFQDQVSLRVGSELEWVLPAKQNKWSLTLEPSFCYYSAETSFSDDEFTNQIVTIEYQSLEVPIGLRHYFFLSKSSKLFVNALFIFDLPISSNVSFSRFSQDLKVEANNSFSFGLGYSLKEKYNIEVRYGLPRGVLVMDSSYQVSSIVLGYTLLHKK